MVGLLLAYGRYGKSSGVRMDSDVPCVVYAGMGDEWRLVITAVKESIIFIDEDHSFIFTEEFARIVGESSNYFVIITRRPLFNLPYSIEEVYGIRTTGKYHFPEKVYHEFYHIYDKEIYREIRDQYTFLLEDSGAGLEFYKNTFGDHICKSSNGNSSILHMLQELGDDTIVVADGAAFGAYMSGLLSVAEERDNIILYLPESFEWLILRSGIFGGKEIESILDTPEKHIESSRFISWERYFTALLQHITENDPVKRYTKIKLLPFYSTGKNREAILPVMPEEIRNLAIEK
ncbi:MAG: translation initiation factor 2 [Lachnospiraceae bacterium]|nr:translation initiation factor 2 [Lachnospiraceae bacterium]